MDDIEYARPRFFRAIRENANLTVRTPEGLFDDLLEKKTYDLLGLEEILAHSVDAIVIFPESPGSFAELGAFSGNKSLKHKTICILESKYKSDLSFVNVGPVKILKNVKSSRVIHLKYKLLSDRASANALATKIITQIRRIKKEHPREDSGLFLLEDLITYALFCLESASPSEIKKLFNAKHIGVEPDKLEHIYGICLNTLLTANKIEKNEHGLLRLSKRAAQEILTRSSKERLQMLRGIRIEAMNSSLRRHAETKWSRMQKLLL